MINTSFAGRVLAGVAGLALCHPLPAQAQDIAMEQKGEETQIDKLEAQVAELSAREATYVGRLQVLEQRLQAMEQRAQLLSSPVEEGEAAEMRGAYISPLPVMLSEDASLAFFRQDDVRRETLASSLAAAQDGDEPERRAPAPTEAVVEVAQQQQGRFGSRIGLELGLGYTHFDSAKINLNGFLALDAIFLGTISIDQVTSEIFTVDPTLRFGLSDRLFFDASIPFLYRSSNFRSGGAGGSASALVEQTVHDSGLGDLTVGANYRIARESAGRPDLVLSARLKVPTGRHAFGVEFTEVANSEGNLQVPDRLATGSGVFGASIGLSALKTLDPMVVYGSASYFLNFSRHFSDIDENIGDIPGTVDAGDAFQIGAGLAFALNDKSSISMSITDRIVRRSSLQPDGQLRRVVVGSQANVGLMNFGATFSLGSRLALVTNVGLGLTDDSPDMSISIRIPYRF